MYLISPRPTERRSQAAATNVPCFQNNNKFSNQNLFNINVHTLLIILSSFLMLSWIQAYETAYDTRYDRCPSFLDISIDSVPVQLVSIHHRLFVSVKQYEPSYRYPCTFCVLNSICLAGLLIFDYCRACCIVLHLEVSVCAVRD